MSKTVPKEFSSEELCKLGKYVIKMVVRQILDDADNDPDNAFEQLKIGSRGKPALRVDINAEDTASRRIRRYKGEKYRSIGVLGEERLANESLDLTGSPKTWALADALDGTDLIERGLGNWCSALVLYCPSNDVGKRIMAVVVGMPNSDIYYSSQDDPDVWVESKSGSKRKVFGPKVFDEKDDPESLDKATICFYGQKISGLKSIFQTKWMQHPELLSSSKVRYQTLAGIPMMLKLSDHRPQKESRGIEVVFDLRGQKPHDVVPGAYLCLKAGAHILDMKDGMPLTIDRLEESLLRPANDESKLKYVMAPTARLAREMYDLLTLCANSRLTVEANVAGANIEVDGAFVGNSPSTLLVTSEEHTISVVKKGYEVWSRTMLVSGPDVLLTPELQIKS